MRLRRRTGLVALVMALTLSTASLPAAGAGAASVRFMINEKQVWVNGAAQPLDAAPVIIDGRTFAPVRAIIEPLGAVLNWDPDERKVTITQGDTTVELWIGKPQAVVNGVTVPLDPQNPALAPIILEGRMLLPIRFVAETLGYEVKWDAADQMISVTVNPPEKAGWYRIQGTVRETQTGKPIAGARIVARTEYQPAGTAPTSGPATAAPGAIAPAPDAPEPVPDVPAGSRLGVTEDYDPDTPPGLVPAEPDTPAAPGTGGLSTSAPAPGAPGDFGAPGIPEGSDTAPSPTGSGGTTPVQPVYEFKTESRDDGSYVLDVPVGAGHRVTVTNACYANYTFSVRQAIRFDVGLEPATPSFTTPLAPRTFRMYGQVQDQAGQPMAGACVTAATPPEPYPGAFVRPNTLPAITAYLTDESGNYFVDWPTWYPIYIQAVRPDCDTQSFGYAWRMPTPSGLAGEGGPMNAGGLSPNVSLKITPDDPLIRQEIALRCGAARQQTQQQTQPAPRPTPAPPPPRRTCQVDYGMLQFTPLVHQGTFFLYFDGRFIGTNPVTNFPVREGWHRLGVRTASGYVVIAEHSRYMSACGLWKID